MAEVPDVAFGKNGRRVPIIVRPMWPTLGGQITRFTDVSCHPTATDRLAQLWIWGLANVPWQWRRRSAISREEPAGSPTVVSTV